MKREPTDRPTVPRYLTDTTCAIPLRGEYEAIIDRADIDLVAGFFWRPLVESDRRNTAYAHAWQNRMHVYLHRLVFGAGPKDEIDHINGNGLDNRRLNLRIATRPENGANRPKDTRRNGAAFTSQYKGVYWDTSRKRWTTRIHFEGKGRMLGRFDNEVDAARAYDSEALLAWGEYARLNVPEE